MKKLIIVLLMFTPIQMASGQDKIITVQMDTIHCRIISVSPERIHYEQPIENQQVIGKFIPSEQVLEFYQTFEPFEIYSNFQSYRQKPKSENKHYIGLNTAFGIGKNLEKPVSTRVDDYLGIGFKYAYRKENSEIGTGFIISPHLSIVSVPLTMKKYLGKYVNLGFGLMIGYGSDKGICIGALVMTGLEYVFEEGFAISISPHLRYDALNMIGRDNNTFISVIQQAGVKIGFGYLF